MLRSHQSKPERMALGFERLSSTKSCRNEEFVVGAAAKLLAHAKPPPPSARKVDAQKREGRYHARVGGEISVIRIDNEQH